MREQLTKSRQWAYTMVNDEMDQPVGVFFRRHKSDHFYRVVFTGQKEVCLDWACKSKDRFFQKYSQRQTPTKHNNEDWYRGAQHMINVAEKKARANSNIVAAMRLELESFRLMAGLGFRKAAAS